MPHQPKFDPFKPEDPKIPGVPAKRPQEPPKVEPPLEPEPELAPEPVAKLTPLERFRQLPQQKQRLFIGGGLLVVVLLIWAMMPSSQGSAPEETSSTASEPTAGEPTAPDPAAPPLPTLTIPGEVATLEELAAPWSSKKFLLRQGISRERLPAMVIRLPGGSSRSADSYWGLLLRPTMGRCDMELVTDLQELQATYGYRARHPMVVDPCNATVYDPTRYGSIGGAYARGAVVQGSAFRPPLSIELKIEGNSIHALRTE